jgi:hypothetical protein
MTAPTEPLTRPELMTEPGDRERLAHYVDRETATDAMVFGFEVTALRGFRWIPSRDPRKFAVCPECKRIFESLGWTED